jgi:hypothetical protein
MTIKRIKLEDIAQSKREKRKNQVDSSKKKATRPEWHLLKRNTYINQLVGI